MSSPLEKVDSNGKEKAQCKLCGKWYHRIDLHLEKKHTDVSEAEYKTRFPSSPMLSDEAIRIASRSALSASDLATKAAAKTGREKEKAWSKGSERITGKRADFIVVDDPAAAGDAFVVEKVAPKSKPVVKDGSFKMGPISLKMRKDLDKHSLPFVPEHDEHWHMGDAEKERWEAMALAIAARDNTLIVGPTGCGKSASVIELAAVLNQPLRRVNVHGDVRASDFLGDKTVDVDTKSNQAIVSWVDGILPEAMRLGWWLLIDEIDAMPPNIAFVLQAVLDTRTLTIPATKETLKAHPEFRIFATANTLGRGDETGLYTGTNVLNEAFLDRFGVVLQADYPDADVEADILYRRTNINKEDAAKMVDLARSVRKAAEAETCYCTLGTRRLISWAGKAVALGSVPKAAKIAILNRLNPDDSKFVGGLVQRFWGSR